MIFIINELFATTASRSVIRPCLMARETTEAFTMNKLPAPFLALLVSCSLGSVSAADWITQPSYYTHDPMSGERVQQYTPIGPFYSYAQSSYVSSGYRNTRSSIQVGTSADHYHTTQQWGAPVQPYGEWRFPYRPYSVPYGAWGPQFYGGVPFGYGRNLGGFGPGYGGGLPGGGFPGGGLPGGGGGLPGQGNLQRPIFSGPNPLQPGYSGEQQLLDGRYPPADQLSPFERKQLFDHYYPPRPEFEN